MPSFDAISIVSAMVLGCFVCDERSGLCRVYVKYGTNVWIKIKNWWTIESTYETIGLLCEGLRADEYLVRKTLSPTHRPPNPNTVGKLKISAFSMCY
jgi:hypothetical protein